MLLPADLLGRGGTKIVLVFQQTGKLKSDTHAVEN